MEKKHQLNLKAPFYSVRRFSPPSHSWGESTKPKSIKDEPSLLPPLRRQSLPLLHKNPDPASVPFRWEQTPGRSKFDGGQRPPSNSSSSFRFFSGEIPRPPPGRMLSSGPPWFTSGNRSNDRRQQWLYKPQVEGFSFVDHASLLEELSQGLECNKGDESNSGDEYSDAALTLSSGSRGSRGEPSGTFSVDKGTRELMMDRFLPAARAAVLETNAKRQQPKTAADKKMVVGEVEIHGFEGTLPYYGTAHNYVCNKEGEDEEYNNKENNLHIPDKKPGKIWGIIPRFSAKSSLCMSINPSPALKPKPGPQTPLFGEVRRLTRKALSGPLDKIAGLVPPRKKKSRSGLLPRELPRIEGKWLSNSGQFPSPRCDSYSLSASPLRRYRSGNSSPCRNEIPKSPSRQVSGFSTVHDKVDKNRTNNNYKFDDSKLVSYHKLFQALQDVSKNQKNYDHSRKGENGNHGNNEDVAEVKCAIREEEEEEERRVESNEFICKSPPPPPLPKSPSESWQWRTLPSGNRKSPVRCNKNGETDSNVRTNWETIVKSSNLHRDRFRYSQELTPPRLPRRQ